MSSTSSRSIVQRVGFIDYICTKVQPACQHTVFDHTYIHLQHLVTSSVAHPPNLHLAQRDLWSYRRPLLPDFIRLVARFTTGDVFETSDVSQSRLQVAQGGPEPRASRSLHTKVYSDARDGGRWRPRVHCRWSLCCGRGTHLSQRLGCVAHSHFSVLLALQLRTRSSEGSQRMSQGRRARAGVRPT